MSPEEATMADPNINPNGLQTIEEVRAQYEIPELAESLDGIDKYQGWKDNNNEVEILLQLGRTAEGDAFYEEGTSGFTGFSPQGHGSAKSKEVMELERRLSVGAGI